ncbi:MAG: CBS domain-containing protein [Archaeoglobus sp.]|nr:CBS domain-containing protein [Archaeoglobus sp.]
MHQEYDDHSGDHSTSSEEGIQIKKFLKRELVHVSPETSIREAAALMHKNNVSSVVVMKNDIILGILTDSDLRRLVAENFDLNKSVREFLKLELTERRPLVTVESNENILAVLSKMLENRIKHTIVMEGGKPKGVITLGDIAYDLGPFYIKYIIKLHHTKDVEEIKKSLEEFNNAIKHQALRLIAESKDINPNFFFEAISYVVDSAAKSLTRIIGEVPEGLVYAATGSWGRREQFLLTDRDTLAIYSSESSESSEDLEDLEFFMEELEFRTYVEDLEDCMDEVGFPPCPHGYTARRYIFPEDFLKNLISEWAKEPEANAVDISIIADARAVLGDSTILERIKETLAERSHKDRFLIRHSMMYKPALNVLGRLVKSFNFKSGAIAPIEYPIRALSITNGITHPLSTYGRIKALEQKGILSHELASELLYSYDIIMKQKISLQIKAKSELDTSELTPIERNMLENALKTVRKFQDYVERNYI